MGLLILVFWMKISVLMLSFFVILNQLLMSLSSVLYSIATIISLSIPLFHGEFEGLP